MHKYLLSLLLILSLLTSCKKSTPPPLPPEEIIKNAVNEMKAQTSFHFVIERTGALAYIDTENTLAVNRIEGDFVTPDRVQGKIRVSFGGLIAEVNIVSIEGRFWQTNPLTNAWEEYDPTTVFNPATLFDPQIGIEPILETDLTAPKLVGNEKLDKWPDKQLYHISGQMKGETIYALTLNLIGPEMMNVDLWVAPKTFEIHRLQITDPTEGGEATVWTLDFLSFGQKVDIQPPTP